MHYLRIAFTAAALLVAAPPAAFADVLVVASNGESRVDLVDTETLRVVGTVPTGKGPHETAVSPDGRRAYIADSGAMKEPGKTITVVDLESRTVVATYDVSAYSAPHDLKVSRKGDRLWVTCATVRTILEIDTATGSIVKAWKFDQQGGWMLVVTPDERKIYVPNYEGGSISVIDRSTGSVRNIASKAGEIGIDASPNGREVWASNADLNRIQVIDTATDRVVATFDSGGKGPVRLRFTPDGKRVVVSHDTSKEVTVIDAKTRRVVASIPLPATPKVLSLSGDGKHAFLTMPTAHQVALVDLGRRTVATVSVGKTPDGISWADPASKKNRSRSRRTN